MNQSQQLQIKKRTKKKWIKLWNGPTVHLTINLLQNVKHKCQNIFDIRFGTISSLICKCVLNPLVKVKIASTTVWGRPRVMWTIKNQTLLRGIKPRLCIFSTDGRQHRFTAFFLFLSRYDEEANFLYTLNYANEFRFVDVRMYALRAKIDFASESKKAKTKSVYVCVRMNV